MLSIGDIARHGRVSVRMLRHYDAIGLLRPAHVDRATGYRSYDAAVAVESGRRPNARPSGHRERRGVARDVAARQCRSAADARLAQVEARDHQAMGVRVRRTELTGTAASFEPESISPVI